MSAPPQTHSKDPVDDKNLWATQPFVVRFASRRMGIPLVLDVAAQAHTAKCPQWYGPEHPDPERRCGLSAEWVAGWWANPPFGTIDQWVRKVEQSRLPGAMSSFASLETNWGQTLVRMALEHRATLVFPSRRLAHIDVFGEVQTNPPKASVIALVWGEVRKDQPMMESWEPPERPGPDANQIERYTAALEGRAPRVVQPSLFSVSP